MFHSTLAFGRGGLVAGLALAAFCVAGGAHAQTNVASVYVEAGRAPHDGTSTNAATIGLRVPTGVRFFDGKLSMSVDSYVSGWRTHPVPGADARLTQVGIVPMFRYNFAPARSTWFIEAGVGASYLLSDYRSVHREFSTRWNFSDHLGVGRTFGQDGRHELGLYVKHVSNAGLKEPNPGETFYMLRYGYAL